MKINFASSIEIAKGLTNNQTIDIIEKARQAYGSEWSITACENANGLFTVSARHVATYVKSALVPDLFSVTTIRSRKLKRNQKC